MQRFPFLCILLIEEFGNCKLLSSIDLHLLPVHVCVESNWLLTCYSSIRVGTLSITRKESVEDSCSYLLLSDRFFLL